MEKKEKYPGEGLLAEGKRIQLERKIAWLTQTNDYLYAFLDSLVRENEKMYSLMHEMCNAFSEISEEIGAVTQVEILRYDNRELEEKLAEARDEVNGKEAEIEALSREMADMFGKYEKSEKRCEEYEIQLDNLRSSLKSVSEEFTVFREMKEREFNANAREIMRLVSLLGERELKSDVCRNVCSRHKRGERK